MSVFEWFKSLGNAKMRMDYEIPEVDMPYHDEEYYGHIPVYAHHYSFNRPVQYKDLYCRAFMPPVTTLPAVAPVESRANDKACVKYRIEKVRNRKRIPQKWRGWCTQWVNGMVDRIGMLEPWDRDRVLDKMPKKDRAENIRRRDYIKDCLPSEEEIRTFQKRETYATINAPRNISPVSDSQLLESSTFTYPLYEALKHSWCRWWGPGKSPSATAEQVALLTEAGCFGADYSKFDGHQNRGLRHQVFRVLREVFPAHRNGCKRWYDIELRATGKTRFGVTYDLDGTMPSGSAFTTIGNTLLNSLVFYLAFRLNGSQDPFRDMDEGCILYGDDSVGLESVKSAFFTVCEELGIAAGEEDSTFGTSFLGRIYPFQGDPYSFCDPRRMLSKLHTTTAHMGFTIEQAACNKAHGVLAMCEHEPWISRICNAILRAYGNLDVKHEALTHSEKYLLEHMVGYSTDHPRIAEVWDIVAEMGDISTSFLMEVMESYDMVKSDWREFPNAWYGPKGAEHFNKFEEEVYLACHSPAGMVQWKVEKKKQ
nr:MAG: RNA-dependent RNA polymerase [Wufeng shrew nodavirus 10]